MPPRTSLVSSFSVTDVNNEVVCPLKNHDGTGCRKRCIGEKRYRSMQEHIRRAHPEHYIPKLPATEESFFLMINTPPSERPPPPPPSIPPVTSAAPNYGNDAGTFFEEYSSGSTRNSDDPLRRGSIMPAAAALASLHNHRPDPEPWFSEEVMQTLGGDLDSKLFQDQPLDQSLDQDAKFLKPKARFAPMTLEQQMAVDEPYFTAQSRPKELLPSSLASSPPGRTATLGSGPRAVKPNRPRKSSVGQNAMKAKHERKKSKEHGRRLSYDHKATTAESSAAAATYGKRWEDLIDAAASATEEDSRDLTPVPGSPHMITNASPSLMNRSSLPPYMANQFTNYQASPLQNALTPPQPETNEMLPFASVESSIESAQSGHNFHIPSQGLSDTSPLQQQPMAVQIYCGACRKLSILMHSYACSECISGFCQDCVDVLISEQTRGRSSQCPRCHAIGGKYKPFKLDIR